MVPARYRSKAASSDWTIVGLSQVYMERMKSIVLTLCGSNSSSHSGSGSLAGTWDVLGPGVGGMLGNDAEQRRGVA